ncbi:MAG TPA: septum formation initiator family protein, partial [Thermoleophilaceae bacterium]|nr:septum formation initiator family protein [Thermoleophilaceae bacterium]
GIRTSGIRWDRLSRVALLALLGAILLMYVSPAKHWWESSRTASAQSEELSHLEAENKRLKQRAALLKNPDTLELEARKLGMTRSDERAFVIENPPRR